VPAERCRTSAALAALACAASLTACSGTPAADAAQTRCGVYAIPQGTPGVPADKLDCLSSAFEAKRTATLTVTELTTEGDPVVTTYTTTVDGTLVVVVDSTADTWAGSGAGIVRYECRSPTFSLGRVGVGDCDTIAGPRESPSD
jgi:ABC-type glycerol-3-phosphate transport system substrate-binding protein